MDNDVAGLPTALSNDPVASFIREPVAGVTGEPALLRAFGGEIRDTLEKYPSFLGEMYIGNTPMASKSARAWLGDNCTDDNWDTRDS